MVPRRILPERVFGSRATVIANLSGHKDIAECAVIGISDALKGEIPCGFIVLKTGVKRPVKSAPCPLYPP